MFGHKNGMRTMAQPTENSKRSLSKGRKGTRSCQYLLKLEISKWKARKNQVEGRKGKWYDHESYVCAKRLESLENNLNFAS